MGHFHVNWGSNYSEFKEAYPEINLTKVVAKTDTVMLRDHYVDELANYQYTLVYHKDHLDRILIKIEEARENSDILGEMINKLVGISGKPSKIRQNYCPGFKKFQVYHWASQDNFEILLQFEGKPHQVKLLRLNPQKVKLPFDLCQSLQFVLN